VVCCFRRSSSRCGASWTSSRSATVMAPRASPLVACAVSASWNTGSGLRQDHERRRIFPLRHDDDYAIQLVIVEAEERVTHRVRGAARPEPVRSAPFQRLNARRPDVDRLHTGAADVDDRGDARPERVLAIAESSCAATGLAPTIIRTARITTRKSDTGTSQSRVFAAHITERPPHLLDDLQCGRASPAACPLSRARSPDPHGRPRPVRASASSSGFGYRR